MINATLDLLRSGARILERESGVSLLDHSMRCALIALRMKKPPSMVAAALCHDIGHMLQPDDELGEDVRDAEHPLLACRWLASEFPPEVYEPVRLHVEAKRFLLATEPGYSNRLGKGSLRSLDLQGGAMTRAESAAFLAERYAAQAIALRRLDDAARHPPPAGTRPETFHHWLCLAASRSEQRSGTRRPSLEISCPATKALSDS